MTNWSTPSVMTARISYAGLWAAYLRIFPVSPLRAVLGMKRMERLCAAFGGLRVTLPNRRKGEPFKDRIVRMLETGKSPGRIALELGVTERYVRILARQVKEQPKPQVQLRLW